MRESQRGMCRVGVERGSKGWPALRMFVVLSISAYAHASIAMASDLEVNCTISNFGATTVCYGPHGRSAAERQLTPRPINPTTAVARTTGLALTQEMITYRSRGHGAVTTRKAVLITYVFGRCPRKSVPPSTQNKFVTIAEGPTPANSTGIRIGRTSLQVGDSTKGTVYGPWEASVGIPQCHEAFTVTGSYNRRRTKAIASLILAAFDHGGCR